MKRKLVKHGSATLSVSIPLKWAKHNKLEKGDEIDVEEQDHALIVRADKTGKVERKHFDISDLKRIGTRYMTSAYREGYDEIEFSYKDAGLISDIQEVLNSQIVGFEIVRQGNNFCSIKDISGLLEEGFDVAMRRIWLLLLSMAEDSYKSVIANDKEMAKNIKFRDLSINKFSNYCSRMLIKKGHDSYRKVPIYFHFLREIEHLGDDYKNLPLIYFEFNKKIKKEEVELFKEINDYLNVLYKLFYKFDAKKAEKIFFDTKKLFAKMNKMMHSGKYNNNLLNYLFVICKRIRKLLATAIEIKV